MLYFFYINKFSMRNIKLKIIAAISLFLALWNSAFAVLANEQEQTSDFMWQLIGFLSAETLLKLVFALIVVVITFILAKIVRNKVFIYMEWKMVWQGTNKEEIISMSSRIVNITIIVTWITVALSVLWVDITIFMGWIGFGIGFTLRTFLSNFIAWIIMVSQGIYHNWDYIEVEERYGKIIKIDTLFTTAQQLDWVMFTIPNINFLDKEVRNFNTSDKRRIDIQLHFDYDADIIKIKSVLKKVAQTFDEILTSPEAKVIVESFDDSYIKIEFRPWIHTDDSYITLKSNILETINLAFRQSGIEVAKQKIIMANA